MIDAKLLAILACPACQGDVELHADPLRGDIPSKAAGRVEGAPSKLICTKCGRKYPIKNGIPVLIVDQSEI